MTQQAREVEREPVHVEKFSWQDKRQEAGKTQARFLFFSVLGFELSTLHVRRMCSITELCSQPFNLFIPIGTHRN